MEKPSTNRAKHLAKLRYKDEILAMCNDGKSLREIEKSINYKLVRTNLSTTLSKSTIAKIIKEFNR